MATIHDVTLHIPASLMDEVQALGMQDTASLQEFLLQAATEKVAALIKARGDLEARAARAVPGELGRLLRKAGTAVAIPGDELPDSWTDRIAS